jgi:hypothetical protein
MLYYNKADPAEGQDVMSHEHHHHHHHHPQGQAHPPAATSPSILRLSVVERLGIALVLIAVIWAAVFWAMHA